MKVRAEHEAVRDRLEDLGAEPLGRVTQVDVYYDHPSRSFAETGEALRIREEPVDEDGCRLTYKGPLVEDASKTRREVETGVDDHEALATILTELGFDAVGEVRKTRYGFRHGGFTIALDSVDGLGEFVEVETAAETGAIERERDRAYDLLRRLNLDPAEHLRRSYLELLMAPGDNHR